MIRTYREQRPDATPGVLLAAIATDWFHRIPAVRLAEAQVPHRPDGAYLYECAWQPPTFGGRRGACHAAELSFVFDNLDDKSVTPLIGSAPRQEMANAMHGAWVTLATTGDPGWPAYTISSRTTRRFDTVSVTEGDHRPGERSVWVGRR
ncbi:MULTISPECIES: carboxylesterase/lipase family protein [Streptomyces]|uniref:Carboxylesterase type B domain-containing protein n=1 Tax=Streptomyces gibsoniae TaxID=3075529 RepID=A0ABU2U8E9_9ACTN|nr:hypothetical protein [Streptomyces sp. DSM 41699]MDT0469499.1 hypothetical protein [Streptomyces sp. DSM 41699]